MMSDYQKFYCYGDIHNHVESAQRFLDHEKPAKVIWLGDFFDSMQDGALEASKTAIWLKETMAARPDDVFIQANHDLAYRFPQADKYKICGWSKEKQEAIDRYLTKEHWDRFVIYHKERWNDQDVYFSHAGLNKVFFPFERFDEAHLARISKIAIENGNKPDYNPLFDHWALGPMWMRWQGFGLFGDICQVVGHTTFGKPQIRATSFQKNWNLCMDCAHTYYAVFKEKRAYAIDRHKGYTHLLRLHT